MPLNNSRNPIRSMFEASAAAALEIEKTTAPPTLAEAIEAQDAALKGAPNEIEQFQYNQRLSPQEAKAVELICTHRAPADVDAAIAALQRLRRLAYPLALLVALLFLPSCVAGSASLTYDAATNSFGVSATYPAGKIIHPTK